ncbi:hypothetical protein PSENEW3n2_00001708 [Picochlorum sp. SENEW3]|nr:hypothetical protein PSENEW3n2_00001708 [Picochlorum sp. SENEW3]WPT14478.1 hypothetical protein PSENEW3_00001708 [Picochlorum sp. SENEW3]
MVEKELFNSSSSHEKKYLGILLFNRLCHAWSHVAMDYRGCGRTKCCINKKFSAGMMRYLLLLLQNSSSKLSESKRSPISRLQTRLYLKISNYSGNQLGHYFKIRFNVMVCNLVEMCAFYPHVIDIFLIVAG